MAWRRCILHPREVISNVARLLAGGASSNQATKNGTTPLILSAGLGKTDVVKLLLESGADPRLTLTDSGDSALSIAEHGHYSAVASLLKAKLQQLQ
jgi:ankyrin repeat protein